MESEKQVVRVVAYVRLSARELIQDNTFALISYMYDDYVKQNQGWKFGTIYWDEDCNIKSEKNLPGLSALISDCKAGKVDVVLVKSLSCLAMGTDDAVSVIEMLHNITPPVAILSISENIRTGKSKSIITKRKQVLSTKRNGDNIEVLSCSLKDDSRR